MHRVAILSIVAAAVLLTIVPIAKAQMPHSVCRWAGIGWSDGYHSHTACPPKAHAVYRSAPPVFTNPVAPIAPVATAAAGSPTPATVPWWKIPASPAAPTVPEPLPTPAAP